MCLINHVGVFKIISALEIKKDLGIICFSPPQAPHTLTNTIHF